jgi:hypothetical protein
LTKYSVFAHGPKTSESFGEPMPALRLPLFSLIELFTSNQNRSARSPATLRNQGSHCVALSA